MSTYVLEMPGEISEVTYRRELDGFVVDEVHSVEREMYGQRASMVYEVLTLRLSRRLPGISIDDEVLRDAAARISVGVPAL